MLYEIRKCNLVQPIFVIIDIKFQPKWIKGLKGINNSSTGQLHLSDLFSKILEEFFQFYLCDCYSPRQKYCLALSIQSES